MCIRDSLILLLAMAAANAIAARMYPAGGRVVDEQGQAVEYATVVLLRGGEQVAGMATDDAGRFELKVPTGEYTLSIQYLGFGGRCASKRTTIWATSC